MLQETTSQTKSISRTFSKKVVFVVTTIISPIVDEDLKSSGFFYSRAASSEYMTCISAESL